MNKELILLADRLERMERLDPALGEEAKAALLSPIGATMGANPILDLTACNSLSCDLFGAADVMISYRIGAGYGGRFRVTLVVGGRAAAATGETSLCAAFLAAMCRAAAEL